jgi:dTDP-glucose pyrophosphorylase
VKQVRPAISGTRTPKARTLRTKPAEVHSDLAVTGLHPVWLTPA